VKCELVRVELSARMDGEAPPADPVVDRHLARCAGCRDWLLAAQDLTRRVRVSPARPAPDLVERVLGQTELPAARSSRRRSGTWLARGGLATVGLVQWAVAVSPLLDHPDRHHAVHELGAWDLAFAVGLLAAAARPRRAAGLVPLAGVLTGVMLLFTTTDVLAGRVEVLHELPHLLTAAGLALLWLVDRTVTRAPAPPAPPARAGTESTGALARSQAAPPAQPASIADRPGRITGAA
jgi:predicted anti-sigma-YlaC factor YlaD